MALDHPTGILKGGFRPFVTPPPRTAGEWDRRKPALRAAIRRLLGDLPPLFTPSPSITRRRRCQYGLIEEFRFDNGVGDIVYGWLLLPAVGLRRRPAILYHHYHGGRYEQGKRELFRKAFAPAGHRLRTGEELLRAGYVVLCIDAYAFGERRWQGTLGSDEQGRQTEESLFRAFIWQGRTLWGMMVRDDLLALNYLLSRPEVDANRVAATGMSMGSTRSWWAAALDERIRAVVSVACLTRYQNLIADGHVRNHGIYYYVPGMLKEGIDTESVIGLIAPRPHLTLTGDQDEGSPADGVRVINRFQQRLYGLYGCRSHFRGLLYPQVGHVYTPAMWRETLSWLARHLA